VVGLFTVAATLASNALASQCFPEPGPFVLPLPTVAAPVNARPVVRLRLHDEDGSCPDAVCAEDVERIVLVEAPHRQRSPHEINVNITTATSGRTRTFYLAPSRKLSRETRYELRAVVSALDGQARPTTLLGSFRTGSLEDSKPPEAGVFDPIVVHPYRVPKGIIVLSNGPAQTESYAEVFGTPASDDQATGAALLYAVWSAPTGSEIDYARPPRGLFRPEPLFQQVTPRKLFDLGAESVCSVSSFDLPEWGGLTVGIRPIDLAGNAGAVSELGIDLGPKPPPKPAKRK
jgi:hypothetical protein